MQADAFADPSNLRRLRRRVEDRGREQARSDSVPKVDTEAVRRHKHAEMIYAVLKHAKEFKDFQSFKQKKQRKVTESSSKGSDSS